MRFQFLGTAAAEGLPAFWCECETCRKAAKLGGKNIRRRASYLIDDDTVIDFGPDAYSQFVVNGIDLTRIRRVIYTHPHEDHLNPKDLLSYRRQGFSKVSSPIKVFGSAPVLTRIIGDLAFWGISPDWRKLSAEPVELRNLQTVEDDGMVIKPFAANHAPGLCPFFFSIARSGKRILVANDTGLPAENEWNELLKDRYDMVSVDSTMGFARPDFRDHHMGVNTVVKFVTRMREAGCITINTPVFATHFTHNGGDVMHEKLEEFYTPHQIQVAYDNLVVEI